MKYLLFIFLLACSSVVKREPQSELSQGPFPTFEVYSEELQTEFRIGTYLEHPQRPFKGCVLYLEGLADSLMNHEPLFKRLSDDGYRTVTFDYMGQGGSGGTMNDTRITSVSGLHKDQEIGRQARWVWELFSRADFAWKNRSCRGSRKRVIGWSTGGLAAYKLAFEGWAQEAVLIAPGIHVKAMVGEAATDWRKFYLFQDTITFRTLTRNRFRGVHDPHIDPVKPKTPAKIPLFAANLVASSLQSQRWMISPKVRGLVFLSGTQDTYVDRDRSFQTLRKNAPHFKIKVHDGSLHEMDNELPEVAHDVRESTATFFNGH